MRRKKKSDGPKGVAGWMATYADMVTLMMAFFIMLFAMSQIDQQLFEQFIVAFNPARAEDFMPFAGGGDIFAQEGADILPYVVPPPEPGAEGYVGGIGPDEPIQDGGFEPEGDAVGDMHNTFMTYLAEHLPIADGESPFDVTVGENYLRINIREEFGGVFFASGQARLMPAAISVLDDIGPMLLQFAEDGHGIVIEGHTDNQPINTLAFPSNWTLSGARASSVVEHLVRNWGIDVRMIAGLGRGEHFPIATNDTVEGRAQNRRVKIKIFTQYVTQGGAIGSWFNIPGT